MSNLPDAEELIGSAVTQAQFKVKLKQLIENIDRSYFTLAAANADIANIALDTKVSVLSETEGGDYYKATAGATSLIKSPYDPAQLLKTNATFARSNVTPIAIDTATKTLTISVGLTISSNLETNFEVAPQTVTIPEPSASYLLCYDRATQTASLKTSKTDAEYVLGYVYVLAGTVRASFEFNYTIDGQSVFNQRSATLYATGSNINIDTVANKLNITSGTARLVGDQVNTVIVGTTSITLPASDGFYQLRYNLKTSALSLVALNSARTYLDVDCGVLRKAGVLFTLFGVPVYMVNGKEPSDKVQFGYLLTNVANRINFNTVAGTLTTTSGVRLVVDERSYLMPDGSVDIPSSAADAMYNMSYDIIAGTVHISAASSALNKNRVIFGQLLVMTGSYYVFGIPLYQQDGSTSLDKLKNVSTGVMVANVPASINFNFSSKTVEIAASTTRLLFGNNATSLPATTVDISENPDVWGQLVYNTATGALSKKRTTERLTNQEIRVALFHVDQKEVRDVPWYSINGTPASGISKTNLDTAEFATPYGDVTSTYSGRKLPELNALYTSIGVNLNAFYALYDDLATAYPTYVKKTTLGSDKDGNPIHQYQFNAPDVPIVEAASMKPKIIITSNIHGWEKACTYILYQSLKEICEQWQNNESLEALRWGANLIVIPVINPSGFISLDRKNSNGVDLERNFPTGWTSTDPSNTTYGGVAPLSEPEAVIIDNLLANNTDAIQFMSCHSFSGMTNAAFPNGIWTWLPLATDFGINLAKSLIMKNSIQSKKLYPFIDVDYVGYTDKGAPRGASSYHATHYYGVQGGTFEICGRMYWEPGQPFLSEAVVTCGSNLIINWLLMNIKYATQLYNSQVNI